MSSSNPFRKKASDAASQSPVKSSLRIDPYILGHDAAIPARSKPVKKVRVLSPPPLSPDSPEWPVTNAIMATPPTNGVHDTEIHVAAAHARGDGVAVANPFSSRRHQVDGSGSSDLSTQRRNEGEALKAGYAARQSLNVDAFRKLLMTGKATESDAQADEKAAPASGSSAVGQGEEQEFDGEGEQEQPPSKTTANKLVAKDKKPLASSLPPPPPSSRHGKSLRPDGSNHLKSGSLSDISKPLPPHPVRRVMDNEAESPFDGEAAGSVAEYDTWSSTTPMPQPRKAAPPPRKSHTKTESQSGDEPSPRLQGSESLGRASVDETVLQSEVSRQSIQAPAPPPSRRPHATSKASTHASPQVSPSHNLAQATSPGYRFEASREECEPLAPGTILPAASARLATPPRPPPPPARNSSLRRHRGSGSVESVSRRTSGSSALAAPPPPPPRPLPRPRGSSGSSVDVADAAKHNDLGNIELGKKNAEDAFSDTRRTGDVMQGLASASDPSKTFDILADLDALQREVDALRGKLE